MKALVIFAMVVNALNAIAAAWEHNWYALSGWGVATWMTGIVLAIIIKFDEE